MTRLSHRIRRKIGLVMAGAVLSLAGSARAARPDRPQIPPLRVDGGVVLVGILEPGSARTLSFEITNAGDEAVHIDKAYSSCPCLGIAPKGHDLDPGETVEVVVGVDVPDELGVFARSIQISCEGFPRPLSVPIRGEISYAIRVNPGGAPTITAPRGFVTLESLDGNPFRILSVNGEPPTFLGYEAGSDPPVSRYILRYDWSGRSVSEIPRWFVVETDHPSAGLIDVRVGIPAVWASWRPDRVRGWFDERINLGVVDPGKAVRFTARVHGMRYSGDLQVEIRSVTPGIDARRVKLEPPSSGPGADVVMELGAPTATGYFGCIVEARIGDDVTRLDVYGQVRPQTP